MILASTKERLLKYLEHKGISRSEFYVLTQMKRGLLDSDKLSGSVNDAVLNKIVLVFPDLDLYWLVSGRGRMLRGAVAYPSGEKSSGQVSDFRGSYDPGTVGVKKRDVSLYNLEAGGDLNLLFGGNPGIVSVEYIRVPGIEDCDGAALVRGEAMYPLLRSGDIVAFKQVRDMNFGIFWGELYLVAFTVDGQEYLSVHYLHQSPSEGCVRLVNHNPAYPPKDIPLTGILALAAVKASVRY